MAVAGGLRPVVKAPPPHLSISALSLSTESPRVLSFALVLEGF